MLPGGGVDLPPRPAGDGPTFHKGRTMTDDATPIRITAERLRNVRDWLAGANGPTLETPRDGGFQRHFNPAADLKEMLADPLWRTAYWELAEASTVEHAADVENRLETLAADLREQQRHRNGKADATGRAARLLRWFREREDAENLRRITLLIHELEPLGPPEAEGDAGAGGQAREADEGDTTPAAKPGGWTQAELVAEAGKARGAFSDDTFRRIRKAAGVRGTKRGEHTRRYTNSEILALADEAGGGAYRGGRKIAAVWRDMAAAETRI